MWTARSTRAESFFNVASAIDRLEEEGGGLLAAYGGRSLRPQSPGDSFLALVTNRFYSTASGSSRM